MIILISPFSSNQQVLIKTANKPVNNTGSSVIQLFAYSEQIVIVQLFSFHILILIIFHMRFLIVLLFLLYPLSAANCLQGCLDCDKTSMCTACHQGFELTLLGDCVASKIQGCSLYADSTTCVRCRPTYQLISNACVRDYSGCLVKTEGKQCAKCSAELVLSRNACIGVINCQKASATRCLLCSDGFSLVGGLCVAQPENCVWANPANGVCMQCRNTHRSSGYKCIPKSMFSSNCDLQDGMGKCQQCKQGYTNIAGSCYGKEEAALLVDKQKQVPPQSNLTTTTLNDLAEEPNNQTNNQSLKTALQQPSNRSISIGNSSTAKGKQVMHSSLDLVLSKLAIFCKSFTSSGTCKECFAGCYMAGAYCLPIDPYCKNYSVAAGICKQCYSGYVVGSKNKCVLVKEAPQDPNCKTLQEGQCLLCYTSYYLKQGGCVPNDPLCSNTSMQGDCLGCYQGYLLQDGQCVYNPSNAPNTFDPYCIRINGTDCLLCTNGYYVDQNGFCSPLSLNCLLHDPNGTCLECLSGYELVEHRCVLSVEYCVGYNLTGCAECSKGYELDDGACIKSDPTCATYSEQGLCVACVATYYLVNGKCVFPSLGFDPLCTSYLNSFCSSCRQGSFLANYRCFPIDPSCTSFDYTRLRCIHCANGLSVRGVGCR